MSYILDEEGYETVLAEDGEDALAQLRQAPVDLVLTDFVMPFIDGAELAARIKYLSPSQPILMMTGYDMRVNRCNPVDGVLQKPFDLGQLRYALTSVL